MAWIVGEIITAYWNHDMKYYYGSAWPCISIARVPGADQHAFVWSVDKGRIHPRIMCCGGCGAEISYDELQKACQEGDQALAELGAKIGSCEGGVLRRRIREILSEIEVQKFKAYLADTRRSALSESLREDLG